MQVQVFCFVVVKKSVRKKVVFGCECQRGIRHGGDIVEENDALLGKGFDLRFEGEGKGLFRFGERRGFVLGCVLLLYWFLGLVFFRVR